MILIVDYDVGNIASLLNMFEHIGFEAEASSDPARIAAARKLVLPGVGAFDKAMQSLQERSLVEPIRAAAGSGKCTLLGICLGMQLLARRSDEGALPGLGLVDADVRRIPAGGANKVPHIGWSEVSARPDATLFSAETPPARFYFVHSYFLQCDNPCDEAATIEYGQKLCIAVERANILGVQFHPEKSHRHGMRLLTRFAEIT